MVWLEQLENIGPQWWGAAAGAAAAAAVMFPARRVEAGALAAAALLAYAYHRTTRHQHGAVDAPCCSECAEGKPCAGNAAAEAASVDPSALGGVLAYE